MQFINRKKELDFLKRKHKSQKGEMIVLYGRRRIGKTELLNKFTNKKRSLYFLGRLESKKDSIKRINNLFAKKFEDTDLMENPLENWDQIFSYIGRKSKERLIFIIDEFPFLVERNPEVLSVLQDKWDNLLKNTKIMLILCGSSVGMMKKYAIDYKSPLYGRRTGQWKVRKMDPAYLTDFFPKYNMKKRIILHSILDSIPGYLVKFNPKKSLWKNIENKILSKGEFLYEEVNVLLREELRDPSNYFSILSSIAGGATTFNEIQNKTGLDKSLISKYLFTLKNLQIVRKSIPVTETQKSKLKSKNALYFLEDNFFDFWLTFIYLNQQSLERGNTKKVLKEIKQNINSFMGKKFERFIIKILHHIFDYTKLGSWWYKDEEIDIVGLNEKNNKIFFGECKWKTQVNSKKIAKNLIKKAKHVKWKNKRKETYAIFAKSFRKKIKKFKNKKVICFDMQDIENIIKDSK